MASNKKRLAPRKNIDPLHVSYLTSIDNLSRLATNCIIVQASTSGLLLEVERVDLVKAELRKNLNLDCLLGERVFLHLEEMDLELSGVITRTQLNGKRGFHIVVDYSDDAPEYWRECLMDLLPSPGEVD